MAKRRDQPHQIGRYEIRRELGRGVMGVVYQAWDTILGRTIALKTITPVADTAEQREAWERRFLIEAQAAARLSHPAIVVVYDVGRDPDTDTLYIALEYLEGQSLSQKSGPGRPLPWREALRIVGQVAEGLHHAHTQGVIHRDIKPANVMVLPSGDAKILDFGVARLDEGSLTNPGDLCGTPLYMSPEQASGHSLDARSDIFSLGAVAWTLLTGQSPFDAPTVSAILMRVMHKSPPPPSELVRGVPKAVDEILARALAKMPGDRYPDARQLAEDVEDALADRVPRHRAEWTPVAAGERTRISAGGADAILPALAGTGPTAAKPRRHRRVWLGLGLLLGLAAAAFLHFRTHPEDRSLLVALLRGVAQSPPAQAAYAWLHPAPNMASPPAAAAATAWPEAAPPPPAVIPRPVVASTAGEALDLGAKTDAQVVIGEGPEQETAPASGETSRPPSEPAVSGATSNGATVGGEKPASPQTPADLPTPPQPAPTAAASGAASPTRARPAPTPLPRNAYLSIGFTHRLRSGTLEVWVDGGRVVQEQLDSRTTKKVLVLEVRKGSVQQTLPLLPGRHEVKVRIRSGGETKTARTTSLFRAGATRRLEISLSRLSGRISLEWR